MKLYLSLIIILISTNTIAHKSIVESYFKNNVNCQQQSHWFYFCGSEKQLDRVVEMINNIRTYEIGSETLNAIEESNRRVLIMHKASSISSAGKTLAPAVSALSNGKGADVVIQMNFNMPEQGTHLVAGLTKKLIPFTALQNFFHELSHARHKMNGTFWMSAGEKQAIKDENIFREQEAIRAGSEIQLRDAAGYADDDMQIWFGEESKPTRRLSIADIPMV
jgi:hypothetical protein